MCHDDELALLYESLQHADEAVDVTFIKRRIHFIENAERAWPHHVNREQQRDRCHGALASAQQRHALQLFARRFCADLNSAVERIILIEQGQVCAPAAEELAKHFAEVHTHLCERLSEQLPRGRIDLRNHVEQFAARICEIVILPFEEFVAFLELVVLMDGIEIDRAHVVELATKIGN